MGCKLLEQVLPQRLVVGKQPASGAAGPGEPLLPQNHPLADAVGEAVIQRTATAKTSHPPVGL